MSDDLDFDAEDIEAIERELAKRGYNATVVGETTPSPYICSSDAPTTLLKIHLEADDATR